MYTICYRLINKQAAAHERELFLFVFSRQACGYLLTVSRYIFDNRQETDSINITLTHSTYMPLRISFLCSLNPAMLNKSRTNFPLMFMSNCEFECKLGDMLTSSNQGFRFWSNKISNPNNSWTEALRFRKM